MVDWGLEPGCSLVEVGKARHGSDVGLLYSYLTRHPATPAHDLETMRACDSIRTLTLIRWSRYDIVLVHRCTIMYEYGTLLESNSKHYTYGNNS